MTSLIMSPLQVRLLIDCNFESANRWGEGAPRHSPPEALSPLLPSPEPHRMMSAARTHGFCAALALQACA